MALYGIGGAGASALVLGLIGGYPTGGRTAAALYREGLVSRDEAERLLTFCNNANPAFLITVLGVGVFGSFRAGLWLWLIHILSALLTGLFFRRKHASHRRCAPPSLAAASTSFPVAFVSAVRDSAGGMLTLCAFVVLFYVLVSPSQALPLHVGAVLTGVTELFSLTPLLRADPLSFILASGCAGWGGLSVLSQTAAVLDSTDLSLWPCLRGKITQGGLAAVLAALATGFLF
jgi:hypothetical protein